MYSFTRALHPHSRALRTARGRRGRDVVVDRRVARDPRARTRSVAWRALVPGSREFAAPSARASRRTSRGRDRAAAAGAAVAFVKPKGEWPRVNVAGERSWKGIQFDELSFEVKKCEDGAAATAVAATAAVFLAAWKRRGRRRRGGARDARGGRGVPERALAMAFARGARRLADVASGAVAAACARRWRVACAPSATRCARSSRRRGRRRPGRRRAGGAVVVAALDGLVGVAASLAARRVGRRRRRRVGARSIHWSPYDRVRVVNADP